VGSAGAVARRELAAYFRAPAGWAVLALFLCLQGIVFWMFVRFLARPDAPPGGVMEFFFGGTILYWIALGLLATVTPMRLLAEERRSGTIEPLLTAPVTPREVVVGKWLAAVAFYLCAWAPTLLYLVYLRACGAHADAGAVAAGYLGTVLLGAAALALGLLASALTRNQIVAATLSFVAFFVVLLVGVLETQVRSPALSALLRRASLFRIMEDFGHGIVDSRHLVLLASVAAVCLVGAAAALARLRGPAPQDAPRARRAPALLTPALVLAIAFMVNHLGGRHYLRGDWTRDRLYELSPKTVSVLRALPRDVNATVFFYPKRDSEQGRAVAGLLRELTERLQRYAPARFHVEMVDPDRNPERAEAAQKRYGVSPYDMDEGIVVLTSGSRSKFLTRDDLMDPMVDESGQPGPAIRAWKGEGAFVSAILTVTSDEPTVICFSKGHGEPALDAFDDGGYSSLAGEIQRDGDQARAVEIGRGGGDGGGVPRACRVLVIAEPQRAFSDAERAAVETFVDGGGRLLAMLGPVFNRDASAFAQIGLEPLAQRFGARLGDNLVVDPPHASDVEGPSVWAAGPENYAPHPITARMAGRITYWPRTRQVSAEPAPGFDAQPLVRSSPEGWGETDLATIRGDADLSFDAARDRRGPVGVAVAAENRASGARVVVLGTGRLVMNYRLSGVMLRDYDADFVMSALAWLASHEERAGIAPKIPAHVTLAADEAQVGWAFRLFALGLPLCCLTAGALVWRRRRI
jgi:ABC-2 type transport system permease protein